MIQNMLEYYNIINQHHVNIIYCGPIWASGIEGIASTLTKRLEFDGLPLSASQSVFSVFVEQMNNMLMYSAAKENFQNADKEGIDISKGIFILGTQGKRYFVQTGNPVNSKNVQRIREKIDHLNTLDKQGLRKYYMEQIKCKNINPESKGAGLGLIEIARRASSKIEYDFTPLEKDLTFFSMSVTIG